jgi:hypothetical protein
VVTYLFFFAGVPEARGGIWCFNLPQYWFASRVVGGAGRRKCFGTRQTSPVDVVQTKSPLLFTCRVYCLTSVRELTGFPLIIAGK